MINLTYFGIRLHSLRKQDNLTQLQLANALGVKKSTIGMWENGKREPDFETLEAIADYFNVTINTFFLDSTPLIDERRTPSPLDAALTKALDHALAVASDEDKQIMLTFIQRIAP